MDNAKNKQNFYVIFYLASPRRGSLLSNDQCLNHVQWAEVIQTKKKGRNRPSVI